MKINVQKAHSLSGHRASIYAIEGSDRGEVFYSGAGDGYIAAWNLTNPGTGQLLAQLNNTIYAIHYIAGENKLLVGQNNKGIHLIDLEDKRELTSAGITDAPIFDIKSWNGRAYIATGDGTLIVSSTKDLSVVKKVRFSTKSIRTIAINTNSGELALGTSDNRIIVLDAYDLGVKMKINAHELSIFSLVFSPDHNYLISGSRDARIKAWQSDNYLLHDSIIAHMNTINHITFSPDKKYFATCSMDKTIKIWDAAQFKLLKVIDSARNQGHTSSVNKLLWTQHRNQLISCSDDRTIAVWDLQFNS